MTIEKTDTHLTVTPDEAQRLLSEATPGPWSVRIIHPGAPGANGDDAYPVVECDSRHVSPYVCFDREMTPENAALIARAPDLARTVVAQGEEIGRLRECVAETRAQLLAVGAAYEHATAERDRLEGEVAKLKAEAAGYARLARAESDSAEDIATAIIAGNAAGKWLELHGAEKRAEVAELQALIDGRTTTPTDAEKAALHAAGGHWLTIGRCDTVVSIERANTTVYPGDIGRWWALDRRGRLCPWPRVEVSGE